MTKTREEILKSIEMILTDELALTLPNEIEYTHSLASLGVDSIALMSLIVYLEDLYACEIELTMEESFQFGSITIDTLINKITK